VTTFTQTPGPGEVWLVQPRALIVTIYGLYAREAGGWLSVASLIRLMAAVGADEPAVRSSISRLKQRGILEPSRSEGAAGYSLSARGRDVLAEGDLRIFGRPRAQAADGWVLAVFSVPEQERRRRHALRSRLTGLGFGTVSAGVWIAPAQLAGEASEVLRRHDLDGYVDLFAAHYLAFGDVGQLIGRWWDLERLAREYQAFLDVAGPVMERWDLRPGKGWPEKGWPDEGAGGRAGMAAQQDRAAFSDYVRALTAWRRLPFLDPGLPAELLPPNWPGIAAAAAFGALRERLADPARAHAVAITGAST
jgi:phenylacetic acid degradation operon negative regulatory protein